MNKIFDSKNQWVEYKENVRNLFIDMTYDFYKDIESGLLHIYSRLQNSEAALMKSPVKSSLHINESNAFILESSSADKNHTNS
jgi:hypothetical protein